MSSSQQNDGAQSNATIPISLSLNPGLRQSTHQQPGGATTFILNPSPGTTAASAHQQGTMIHGGNFGHQQPQQQQQQINPMIGAPIMNTQQQQFLPNQSQPMVMVKTEILSNQNNASSFSNMPPVTTTALLQQTNTFTNKSSTATTNGQQKMDNEAIDQNNKDIQNNESKSPIPPPPIVALDKQRLKELVEQVDPNEQLEEEVEDVLLSLADDFIESLVSQACMLAKHRKSNHLDVKDVQLALDMNWNMWIPGFGVDGVVGVYSGGVGSGSSSNIGQQQQQNSAAGSGTSHISDSGSLASGSNAGGTGMTMNRGPKKCLITEAHKQRLALIKKVMKKF
ncbi:uncharacterized protein LOC113791530 [Dermatophagoides pteronyssinus]|uniref:uncharacterized protein LOC113791530 n=1 Tax=Dermatophagoides pteronyssinus TaxID=6956 RepID=UPI003F67A94A